MNIYLRAKLEDLGSDHEDCGYDDLHSQRTWVQVEGRT